MLSNKKTALIVTIAAVFLFALDRYLKWLALVALYDISLIGDFLVFDLAKNYYIAFSLPFGGALVIFLIISIITGLSCVLYKNIKNHEYVSAAILFNVLAGAISNLFDRLKYGYVVDYFDLKYFTVFNVADCMIVVGVLILFLINLKQSKLIS